MVFNSLIPFINMIIYFSQDDEANLAKSLENNCSQIYLKMFSLEKELNLLLLAPSQNNNNINNNNNNNNNNTDNNSSKFEENTIVFGSVL